MYICYSHIFTGFSLCMLYLYTSPKLPCGPHDTCVVQDCSNLNRTRRAAAPQCIECCSGTLCNRHSCGAEGKSSTPQILRSLFSCAKVSLSVVFFRLRRYKHMHLHSHLGVACTLTLNPKVTASSSSDTTSIVIVITRNVIYTLISLLYNSLHLLCVSTDERNPSTWLTIITRVCVYIYIW